MMVCRAMLFTWSLAFVFQFLDVTFVFSAVSPNLHGCHANGTVSKPEPVSCDVKSVQCPLGVYLSSFPVKNFNVTVESFRNLSSGRYVQSLSTVRWNLPDRFESVTGFLIHLQPSDGLLRWCYLLSFNESAWARVIHQFDLSLILQPNNYSLWVHSVSGPPSLVNGSAYLVPHSKIFIKSRNERYETVPAYWITDLIVCNLSCDHTVSVTFELAPDNYNFTTYMVLLVNTILKVVPLEKQLQVIYPQRQRYGYVIFTNVLPGNYTIEVQPENTDSTDAQRCRCRCLDICRQQSGPCDDFGCASVISGVFSIHKVSPGDCSVKIIDPDQASKLIAVAVAFLLATLLLVLTIQTLCRLNHIEIDIDSLEEQKLFVLYLNEEPGRGNVIHHLVHFLAGHCNCSVRTMYHEAHAIAESMLTYAQRLIDSNEKILLIDSSAIHVWLPDETLGDPLDQFVHVFIDYLQQFPVGRNSQRLTIARFEGVEASHYGDRLTTGAYLEFLLMKEIELLVMHIHGFKRRAGRKVYHMKSIPDLYMTSKEGKLLQEAILQINRSREPGYERLDSNGLDDERLIMVEEDERLMMNKEDEQLIMDGLIPPSGSLDSVDTISLGSNSWKVSVARRI